MVIFNGKTLKKKNVAADAMSKSNPFYKNVVFPGLSSKKEEKTLDNNDNLSYTSETVQNSVPILADYTAYSIVRLGHKKYAVAAVEFDSKALVADSKVTIIQEFETEMGALKVLQQKLAEKSKVFRKEIK